MRKRRATLGPKTYLVLLAGVHGSGYVEICASNADMAKRAAAVRYCRTIGNDGYPEWIVMSARAKREAR